MGRTETAMAAVRRNLKIILWVFEARLDIEGLRFLQNRVVQQRRQRGRRFLLQQQQKQHLLSLQMQERQAPAILMLMPMIARNLMATRPACPATPAFPSPGGLENTPVLCYRMEENRPSLVIKQG